MAWDGIELRGAVAWRDHVDRLDIDRLMVDPAAHRQGVGTMLLRAVLDRSAGRPVVVATGRDNVPAVALYRRHGFAAAGDEKVPPGIWITHLRHA